MAARSQQSPGIGKTLISLALQICPGEGGAVYEGCRGPPGVPWGYPSSPLRLQKRPRNLGKPAPMLIAKACLGLQEGGVRAEPNGTGTGNYNGENTRNPTPGGLPSAPWQMSVRVAPSTMNWGFDISSYKTHSHVPGPVPPGNRPPDTTTNGDPLPRHPQNQVPPRGVLLPWDASI